MFRRAEFPRINMEILGMMNGQILRLESYTQKMSSIRKLEDLEPGPAPIPAAALREKLRGMCEILGEDISYSFDGEGTLCLDEALVLEVCENLVSNGLRYARQMLQVTVRVAEGVDCPEEEQDRILEVVVEDDGPGFGPEELRHATEPFTGGGADGAMPFRPGVVYLPSDLRQMRRQSWHCPTSVCGGRVTARFKIFSEKQKSR